MPPPPLLTELRCIYANNQARLSELAIEIYNTWCLMAGPPQRPPDGYTLNIVNRITLSSSGASVLHDGNQAYMMFSMFSDNVLEYAAVAESGDLKDIQIWGKYNTPWEDHWPGMHEKWEDAGRTPHGYNCVRDAAGIDAFTAYFMGFVPDGGVPIQPGSYRAEYHNQSGALVGVSCKVDTGRMTDEEYEAMHGTMMNVIANAVTARETAREYAAAKHRDIIDESPAVFSQMFAEDINRMRAERGLELLPAAAVARTRDFIRTSMTSADLPPPGSQKIEEID